MGRHALPPPRGLPLLLHGTTQSPYGRDPCGLRRGLGEALGRWFGADLPLADVRRILDMIAHDNATRLYGPTAGAGVAP